MAQTKKLAAKDLPRAAFKLISVKVTGPTHYTEEDIVPATGLKIGNFATEDDFKKATQQLGETGLFTNVAYSFHYSSEGTKLEFQLTDNPKLVPARFDNFVWFSDQELLDGIRSRVHLFKGEMPVAGSMPDEIAQALQEMLIERKIQAQVDYIRFAKSDGPIEAMVYSVSGPAIHIRNVSFEGADAAISPALEAAAGKSLKGLDYRLAILQVRTEKDLLPVFLQRGYLKASFGNPAVKVAQDSPDEVLVDVTLPVEAGRQYKIDSIRLSGNTAFTAEQLRKHIQAEPGHVANSVQLSEDVEALKKLYEIRGYMAATIQSTPEFDNDKSMVKYTLTVNEGDVYKMGDLQIRGLDGRTTARLEDQWKIRGGAPFDGEYPAQFVRQALKQLQLMGAWKAGLNLGVNHKEKTVDVTLAFDPQ